MLNQIKTKFLQTLLLGTILVFSGLSVILSTISTPFIPVTAQQANPNQKSVHVTDSLKDFIQTVTNGKSDTIVGVYSPFTMALPVVNQPEDNPGYVADVDGVATSFQLASDAGSIGLLAHYQRSGKAFSLLIPQQIVTLVYGDGKTRDYEVKNILFFQAKDPAKKFTDFVSLDQEQTEYSQKEVFDLVYRQADRLVLQTCLVGNGSKTWGRMFVIAEPITQ